MMIGPTIIAVGHSTPEATAAVSHTPTNRASLLVAGRSKLSRLLFKTCGGVGVTQTSAINHDHLQWMAVDPCQATNVSLGLHVYPMSGLPLPCSPLPVLACCYCAPHIASGALNR